MIPKYIYHYTELETLKLILQNKTLRFKRFDLLNDPDEGVCKISDENIFQPRKSLYCSCWSDKEDEDVSMWYTYTLCKGVRIKIDSAIFGDFTDIVETKLGYFFLTKISDITIKSNIPNIIAKKVYGPIKVKYYDNKSKMMSHGVLGKIENKGTDDEFYCNEIDLLELGLKKSSYWQHENEYRYIISPILKIYGSSKCMSQLEENSGLVFQEHIDIPIKKPIEEVIAGPQMNGQDFEQLKILLEKENINYRKSKLKTRFKNEF